MCCAYPGEESNLQHAGSEPAASTFGLPGHVQCGPSGSRTPRVRLAERDCAPAPSPESQRRESNPHRPLTRRLHDRRAALAVRTLGRIRTGTGRPLRPLPPTVGLRGHISQGPRPCSARRARVHHPPTRLRAASSLRSDSDRQPRPYQGRAPPRELRRQVVPRAGLEPATTEV